MKNKIPHLILAGLFGTAIASQGAYVIHYEEDFAPPRLSSIMVNLTPGDSEELVQRLELNNGFLQGPQFHSRAKRWRLVRISRVLEAVVQPSGLIHQRGT